MWVVLWRSIDTENHRMAGFISHSLWLGHITRKQSEKPRPVRRMGTPESSARNGRKPSSDLGGGLGGCSSDLASHRDSCHSRIRTARFDSRSSSSCSRYLGSSIAVCCQSVSEEGEYASSMGDLESYLLTAFHHRFHRFLKKSRRRHEIFQSVSGPLNLDLLEASPRC